MIKDSKIYINISYRNITHYRKIGYSPILNKKLEIFTHDLPTVSHVKIQAICVLCDSLNIINYCKYVDNVNRHGFYGCKSCSREKFRMTYLDNGGGGYIDKSRESLKNAISKKHISRIIKSEDKYIDISLDEFRFYKNEVRRLTKKSSKILFEKWDGHDYYDGEYIRDYFNLSHIDDKYPSIDHKISIYYGFTNKIPPSEISSVDNLCYTKRFINSTKRENLI